MIMSDFYHKKFLFKFINVLPQIPLEFRTRSVFIDLHTDTPVFCKGYLAKETTNLLTQNSKNYVGVGGEIPNLEIPIWLVINQSVLGWPSLGQRCLLNSL